MYSLVLATMLTTGSATPAWGHWYGGCHGCYGCHGWSCHGCYGGCYGCYGWGYGGCCGGCYGCWGWGCYGCYGGCYGCGYYTVAPVPFVAVAAVAAAAPAAPAAEPAPVMPPASDPRRDIRADTGIARGRDVPADSARVTLMLPPGARLLVNDQPFALPAGARTFETPQLPAGRPYHYVFTAEVERDGKPVRETRSVTVEAGGNVTVAFQGLPAPAPVQAARR